MQVVVAPDPRCPGCLGDGKCWVCLGRGRLRIPGGMDAPCHVCLGTGRCASCGPKPQSVRLPAPSAPARLAAPAAG